MVEKEECGGGYVLVEEKEGKKNTKRRKGKIFKNKNKKKDGNVGKDGRGKK